MKKSIVALFAFALLAAVVASATVHEKVKLTGYVVDVVCFAETAKGKPEAATKAAGEHTKECALMADCRLLNDRVVVVVRVACTQWASCHQFCFDFRTRFAVSLRHVDCYRAGRVVFKVGVV